MTKYNPKKQTNFLEQFRTLINQTDFINEKAVRYIVEEYIKKVKPEKSATTYDALDEQLSNEDKDTLLYEIQGILNYKPELKTEVDEELWKIHVKAVQRVNERFKVDFPTNTLKRENEYELDQNSNAEIVRKDIMTEVDIINKMLKVFNINGGVKHKNVKAILEDTDYTYQFHTLEEDNNNTLVNLYFTNDKDEEMYDYNIYVLKLTKNLATISFINNVEQLKGHRVEDGRESIALQHNDIDKIEFPKVEVPTVRTNVNKVIKDINKVKLQQPKKERTRRYGIGTEIIEEIREILNKNITEKTKYRKMDILLDKVGGITNDIGKRKVNIDIVTKNSIKVLDIVLTKSEEKFKLVDSITVKNLRSRKLKANIKYFVDGKTVKVYIESKEGIEYMETNLIKDSNGYTIKDIYNKRSPVIKCKRKDIGKSVVKFVEQVA